MALVTATVTVDFTANYAGTHRVCWRIQGSGNPYDCTTVVNCVGGGTTCQAIFTTDVNTTSCDGVVVFEGYVQAACEDIASANGRLPFTVDFTPNPICNRHEITCEHTPIDSIQFFDRGIEYLVGDSVQITRNVADTQTADAIVTISAVGTGIINSISALTSPGLGYTALDVLDIDTAVTPGCTGSGAQIRVDTIGGSGQILTYTLINGGTLYNGCSLSVSGGTGAGATFSIIQGTNYDAYGAIIGFTVVDSGDYDIVPLVSIVTGTGSGFSGTVALEDCEPWNAVGTDCNSNVVDLAAGLPHPEMIAVCINETGLSALPAGYATVEIGCCIPSDTVSTPVCVDYHIDNPTGAPVDVQYTACEGIITTVSVLAATTVAICAIVDGVLDPQVEGVTIDTDLTPCS